MRVARAASKASCLSSLSRLGAVVGLLCGLACSSPSTSSLTEPVAAASTDNSSLWWQPAADRKHRWYWQLQGDIDTSHDVAVYNIDIDTSQRVIDILKARGVRLICYFSVGTVELWRADAHRFPKNVVGAPYPQYPDELWLDIANYKEFSELMIERLDRCADKGFDGIEGDNVDAFLQTASIGFDISKQQSIDYILWLAARSHERGLAYGLKNAEPVASEVVHAVDWIITESCFAHGWCDDAEIFLQNNKPVFMTEYIEYLDDFNPACAFARQRGINAIYRDTGLTATGRFEECL